MKISKSSDGDTLTITVEGRLDTNDSHELQEESVSLNGISNLVLDFSNVDYISSSVLRVLLSFNKKMKGNMTVKNPNEIVGEIFEVTGFSDLLKIEWFL